MRARIHFFAILICLKGWYIVTWFYISFRSLISLHLTDAIENLGESEIREALLAKAEYLCRIGAKVCLQFMLLSLCLCYSPCELVFVVHSTQHFFVMTIAHCGADRVGNCIPRDIREDDVSRPAHGYSLQSDPPGFVVRQFACRFNLLWPSSRVEQHNYMCVCVGGCVLCVYTRVCVCVCCFCVFMYKYMYACVAYACW
jgi:hypothetical protein